MKREKPLTKIERAELSGKLEMLKLLGNAWQVSMSGERQSDNHYSIDAEYVEWHGKALDGTIVHLGWFSRNLYNYLKSNPTPNTW